MRKYKEFYKDAKNRSKRVLKVKGNLVKYYIYTIASFFAKILFFPFISVIRMFDYRLSKMVRDENGVINLNNVTYSIGKPKRVYSVFIANLIAIFKYLGIVLVSLIPGVLVGLLFESIMQVEYNLDNLYALLIISFSPSVIFILIYTVIFYIKREPIFYLADSVDTNASDLIKKSFETLRNKGKGRVFLNIFIPGLFKTLLLALFGFIFYFFRYYMVNINSDLTFIGLIVLPILVVMYMLIAPIFTLRTRIANSELFDELFFGKKNKEDVEGLHISSVKMNKNNIKDYSDELLSLFNSSSSQHQYTKERTESAQAFFVTPIPVEVSGYNGLNLEDIIVPEDAFSKIDDMKNIPLVSNLNVPDMSSDEAVDQSNVNADLITNMIDEENKAINEELNSIENEQIRQAEEETRLQEEEIEKQKELEGKTVVPEIIEEDYKELIEKDEASKLTGEESNNEEDLNTSESIQEEHENTIESDEKSLNVGVVDEVNRVDAIEEVISNDDVKDSSQTSEQVQEEVTHEEEASIETVMDEANDVNENSTIENSEETAPIVDEVIDDAKKTRARKQASKKEESENTSIEVEKPKKTRSKKSSEVDESESSDAKDGE